LDYFFSGCDTEKSDSGFKRRSSGNLKELGGKDLAASNNGFLSPSHDVPKGQ